MPPNENMTEIIKPSYSNAEQTFIEKESTASNRRGSSRERLNIQNEAYEIFINDLLKKIDKSYEQEPMSLLFKDKLLEEEFQVHYQTTIVKLAIIPLVGSILCFIFVLIFQLWTLIALKGNYPIFKWIILCYGLALINQITHYLLNKRFIGAALNYANIQMIILIIGGCEAQWLLYKNIENIDGIQA